MPSVATKKAAIPGSHDTHRIYCTKIMVGSGSQLSQMSLLPIDEEKSRRRADEELDKYRDARGMANMPVNPRITSAWRGGMPASTAEHDPYPMQYMQEIKWAKHFLRDVDRAIHALPKRSHQRLLRARYCDGAESDHPDLSAMTELGIASSTYFQRKRDALLAIAFYLHVVVRAEPKKLPEEIRRKNGVNPE